MTHLNYIASDIKALNVTDSIKKAKKTFASCSFSHIPVVKKNQFVGLMSEYDIQAIENDDDKINNYLDLLQHFSTHKKSVWIDLIKLFASQKANILPVIDDNHNYLGYFELNDVLHQFLETPFLNENGILIVVEKNILDFSFSEISQIVEANDANLLGAFISNKEGDVVQITLKISEHDINNTLQTFRRYNYNVIAGNIEDKYFDKLKDRSEYLQKYLNI